MISWADHLQFYKTNLNPYATPEEIDKLRAQYDLRRQERIDGEVKSFWQRYLNAKIAHEHWYGTADTSESTPFEQFFFPVEASYVMLPESRAILVNTIPLFFADNLGGINRMWYPAQWNRMFMVLYGQYVPPQATYLFELSEKPSRDKYV